MTEREIQQEFRGHMARMRGTQHWILFPLDSCGQHGGISGKTLVPKIQARFQ